jgi:PTH1 family peptidyl-tRNA hydrolase
LGSDLRLIVGLGNPGSSYQDTRHNFGREFIDYVAVQNKQKFESNGPAELLRLPVFFSEQLPNPLLVLKLRCYMNESGGPLQIIMQREGLKPNQLLVLVDDFMIPFGSLRLRQKGSDGGHNGLKSIIASLGTQEFGRLRLGIGPVPVGEDPADFVLHSFSREEKEKVPKMYNAMKDSLLILIKEGYEKAMNLANKVHL